MIDVSRRSRGRLAGDRGEPPRGTRSAWPSASSRSCRRPCAGRSAQRARLAALGTAVTKINHDLRNILATARLVTDGLTASAAPEVRRIPPRLIDAIDRAVALCTRTLDFSREGAPPLVAEPISARPADRRDRSRPRDFRAGSGDRMRGPARARGRSRSRPALPRSVEPGAQRARGRGASGCASRRLATTGRSRSRSPMTVPGCRQRRGKICSGRSSARPAPAAAGSAWRSPAN